jgi:hypothetical protein
LLEGREAGVHGVRVRMEELGAVVRACGEASEDGMYVVQGGN